jgi:hypothetical protein
VGGRQATLFLRVATVLNYLFSNLSSLGSLQSSLTNRSVVFGIKVAHFPTNPFVPLMIRFPLLCYVSSEELCKAEAW